MINSTALTEYRDQFFLAHGDRVLINYRFYFEDGAFADQDPLGITALPPADPLQRAKLQAKFWNAKLQRSAGEFDRLSESLRQWCLTAKQSGNTPPSESDLEPLRKLAKVVKRHQKKLKKTIAAVEALTPAHILNQASEVARNAEQADTVIEKIRSIRV
jgi:hypothetical protein